MWAQRARNFTNSRNTFYFFLSRQRTSARQIRYGFFRDRRTESSHSPSQAASDTGPQEDVIQEVKKRHLATKMWNLSEHKIDKKINWGPIFMKMFFYKFQLSRRYKFTELCSTGPMILIKFKICSTSTISAFENLQESSCDNGTLIAKFQF